MTGVAGARFDPEQLLDAIPTPNGAVRAEQRGAGLVLWVPFRRPWWTRGLVRWVLPLRDERGFELDSLGQEVWAACDGERCLERIVEGFAHRHRIRFHEARVAVLAFVRTLVERNLVALVVPGPAQRAIDGVAAGGGP